MKTVACRIAIDLGIFELLENKSSPQTMNDIAERTPGANPTLIGRILRCLESFGAIGGNSSAGYTSSTVPKAFANKRHQACLRSWQAPGWILIPQFLNDEKYQNSTSSTDTPFAKAYGFKDGATIWQILETTDHMPVMGLWMQSFNDGHKNFLDIYPAMDRLAIGASTDSESVMMVDVGGGQGHQAITMRKKVLHLSGRYIVTDLAHGLPVNRDESTGVDIMVHDFMTEMPVEGYSKVIINDWIVPAEGASKFMMAQDFNMMASGGGMERTQALHEEYIAAAGLKISGIWKADNEISESVFDCELPKLINADEFR
ncbi:uncharacterized protein EAF01_010811 [Botrytis porri]|uniref:O-methyltransferase dimerisation domain-containing protein n=1 Tax=Botrytis porri TaxID=87229 RepID=A0A4Z1KJN7_9HELO|nr:uncharacterized protein EAF01_010811 [Botrytis porri]KAF7889318.1 hypothetical protein EAF01_010811 [Botrytis porri]TGO86303.1 hypothetical protein BPOR_0315g00110 [Botrytis porri]